MKSPLKQSLFAFFIVPLLLSLSGCASSSPTGVTRKFVHALTSGDAKGTLKQVCPEGIATVIVMDIDWSDEHYEETQNDGSVAQVRVSGRAIITAEHLEKFAKEMGVNLPRTGVGAQVGVNFDGVTLKYDHDRSKWCVDKKSISDLANYLISLFGQELSL